MSLVYYAAMGMITLKLLVDIGFIKWLFGHVSVLCLDIWLNSVHVYF